MMLKSKSFALLVTLIIILVATLTWIDNNRHTSTTDGVFDKTEFDDDEGRQRELLDLSCWTIGKPPGCNPPPPAPGTPPAPTVGAPTPADAPAPTESLSRYCLKIKKKEKCNLNKPRCKWNNSNDKCQYACEATKERNCSARYCTWDKGSQVCLPQYEKYCGKLSENRCDESLQCEWNGSNDCTPTRGLSRYCLDFNKKDKCNANKPRCRWNNYNGKCQLACEASTKESACSRKYCIWKKAKNACLPHYDKYCGRLGEGRCGESLQCEWRGSSGCKPDAQKKAFNAKMSDRYAKGDLFHR